MKKILVCLAGILFLMISIRAAVADDDHGAKAPALRIGFDESYGPKAGYTLAQNYSKLKQYLEQEFSTTVQVNKSGWTSSTLAKFDVYILPCNYSTWPGDADHLDLREWVEDGGCLVILWYPLWTYSGNQGKDKYWGGQGLHDLVLEYFGMQVKTSDASSTDIRRVASPYDSTPYDVSTVAGENKTAYMHTAQGNAAFLAWNASSQPVASYNVKAGKGKLFLIGSPFFFQNNKIDSAENKEFLFNLVHACAGGGSNPDLMVKKTIFKGSDFLPGDILQTKTKLKNIGSGNAGAVSVTFYLSPDQGKDPTDIYMGKVDLVGINAGKSAKISKSFILPANLGAGKYYLIAIADEAGSVTEVTKTNNTKASKKSFDVL